MKITFLDKFQKISLKDKLVFSKSLSVLVKASIPMNRAFSILAEQTKNPKFKKIILEIQQDIQKGQSIASSLKRYPKVFSGLYTSMIQIGETSGNLEEILKILAKQAKKDNDLRRKVKGAMVYPVVIICAMALIGVLMMIFVIPKLTSFFSDMNAELPITTRLIIGFAGSFRTYAPILGVIIAVIIIGFNFFRKKSSGKRIFHFILLKAPIFGEMSRKINTARLARNLSSLLASGVPIAKAIQTTKNTLTNFYFRKSLIKIKNEIKTGQDLHKSLKQFKNLYPPLMVQMIDIGEETGSLINMLEQSADFYETEIDASTKNLSTIIEPLLMVVIGAVVAFFALSILMPMYSMLENI
tara:strand:- start:7068 stop:8132 length:1065 start_codon:yes stop_codon:yes gene_type:complete